MEDIPHLSPGISISVIPVATRVSVIVVAISALLISYVTTSIALVGVGSIVVASVSARRSRHRLRRT